MTDTTLLTTEEAAAMLAVEPRLLVRWRYDSRGPTYIKVGRLVRYKRADLDAWIEENTHEND